MERVRGQDDERYATYARAQTYSLHLINDSLRALQGHVVTLTLANSMLCADASTAVS